MTIITEYLPVLHEIFENYNCWMEHLVALCYGSPFVSLKVRACGLCVSHVAGRGGPL